ncbi:MAG: FtsQ-type POTRA domain-containing protein [Bacilli bacterium]
MKKVKKKKLKVVKLILFLLIIYIIYLIGNAFLGSKINNIYIFNNNLLSDYTIIKQAKIKDYPSFFYTTKASIKRRLMANPIIKEVKVKKSWGKKISITIDEYKVLFKKDNKYVLENKEEITSDLDISVPKLINYVPDLKYEKFISEMVKIDDDILNKVSEIEYKPNDLDKDRFLLYMTDKNLVYLTLTKYKNMNYYNEVLPQLEGKRGILYLDSGNHFEILE